MKEGFKFMCLKLGMIPEIEKKSNNSWYNFFSRSNMDYYRIKIPKTVENCRILGINVNEETEFECSQSIKFDDKLVCRIKNIQDTKYQGILYDLQMQDEHNYLLSSGLVHNGGGKRNGSIAIYVEPWHADIL